jgi:hypothetical protein
MNSRRLMCFILRRGRHTSTSPKQELFASQKSECSTSAKGHSRPSHFVPVLNNVRYASDSDHSRYESELTLWANSGLMHRSRQRQIRTLR